MLTHFENTEIELPESDYLPDYGVVYNESGLADTYLGHLFGLEEQPAIRSTIRPAFITKNEA